MSDPNHMVPLTDVIGVATDSNGKRCLVIRGMISPIPDGQVEVEEKRVKNLLLQMAGNPIG